MKLTDSQFMSWYSLTKEFYDYADDIEGVNIHYLWTSLDESPDWENQRITRFMPQARLSPPGQDNSLTPPRLRRKLLKLPVQIAAGSNGMTDHYLLHHYFEVFLGGRREYSPLYSEEIVTGVGNDRVEDEARALPAPQTEVVGSAVMEIDR